MNKNKKYHKKEVLSILFFAIISLILWPLILLIFRKLLSSVATIEKPNLDITAIVLGAVAAFAGLLIPLHYALTLDIIGKIKDPFSKIKDPFGRRSHAALRKNRVEREIECLLRYCHTSDLVIFVTALFGFSSLLEGTFIIGSNNGILKFSDWSVFTGNLFFTFVLLSCLISFTRVHKEWKLSYYGKSFCVYCFFILCTVSLSIVWWQGLICLNNENSIAFLALGILSLFYFLWLLLRVFFTPMSRVTYITIFAGKNDDKENSTTG
ncbi:MAG: hypothetical protein Q8P40_09055 [Nitrospirota bacterium]|nr:hypothetical protein [Nitrospirota bacterium]